MNSATVGIQLLGRPFLRVAMAVSAALLAGCGGEDLGLVEEVEFTQAALDVSNWDQLVAMGSTGNYVLKGNIDAAGKTWTPKAFSGVFDGGNFTISNLSIVGGSFFSSLTNATVRRLKLTNVRITGGHRGGLGGLAVFASNSTIHRCSVQGSLNVSTPTVGGIVAMMSGGTISESHASVTITGSLGTAGGIAGSVTPGSGWGHIHDSYSQVNIDPSVSGADVTAGGIVGYGYAPNVHDVYSLGTVRGRGFVGGIIGRADCTPDTDQFLVYKTIFRGGVFDANWSPEAGGWAGVFGGVTLCTSSRYTNNLWDKTVDGSTNYRRLDNVENNNKGATTQELRSPTTPNGGLGSVYCMPDVDLTRCGDNTYLDTNWDAGTSNQHHVLKNSIVSVANQPR